MRINPIIVNIDYNRNKIRREKRLSESINYSNAPTRVLPANYVSFRADIKPSSKIFKKLLKYNIPDMYTGKIMFSSDFIQNFIEKGLFDKPINKVVAAILPYKERLQTGEQKVLEILEQDAKTNPKLTLADAVKHHYKVKKKELSLLQEPIFNKLEELSKSLPEDKLFDFQELMTQTKAMLQNKSIVQPFSKTDFRYKLQRFADDIKLTCNSDETKAMIRLIKMTESIPHTPKNSGKPIKKYRDEVIEKQEKQINNLIKYFERTPLAYNQDLRNAITTARDQIYRVPTKVQFSRKTFVYKLNKIVSNIDNQELANEIRSTASKLPTSWQEDSAFFVKCANFTSAKIGISLLRNSVGSIEHLLPQSHGGKDAYSNYGLSAAITNTMRGCKSMEDYLRLHPEAYENCQKYVDRIVELTNKRILKRLGIPDTYIVEFANTMRRLSPKEKPMILDLSALK